MKDWFKPWLGNRLRDLPIKAVLTLSADDKYYSENEDNGHRWNFAIYLRNTSKSANGDRPYLTYINEDGQEVVARGSYNYISDGWIYFEGNSGSNLFASWEYPNIYVHGDFSVLQIVRGHFENINVSNTSIDTLLTSALRYKDTNRSVVYNIQACNCSQLTDGGKFYVRDTHIKSVDVSGSALNSVSLYTGTNNVSASSLVSFTANDCPNLEQIYLTYCKGDISASNNPKLTTLWARYSALGSLTFNNNNIFETLYFDYAAQPSGTVSISGSTADFSIYADYSTLTNLNDFVKDEMKYLGYLEMIYNSAIQGTLDLSEATALRSCYLGRCTGLEELYLSNAQKLYNLDIARCYALKELRLPIPQSDTAFNYISAYDNTNLTQISIDGGKTYTQEPDLAYPNLVTADLHGWSQSLGNIQLGTYDNAVLRSVNVNSSGISGVIAKTCYDNQNAPTLTYASTTRLVAIERAKNLTSFKVLAGVVSLTLKYCGITALDCSAATGITTVDITGSAICADASALTAFAKTLPDYSDGTKGGRVVVGDWMTAATQDALTASLPGGWQLQTYAIGPDDPTPLDA